MSPTHPLPSPSFLNPTSHTPISLLPSQTDGGEEAQTHASDSPPLLPSPGPPSLNPTSLTPISLPLSQTDGGEEAQTYA